MDPETTVVIPDPAAVEAAADGAADVAQIEADAATDQTQIMADAAIETERLRLEAEQLRWQTLESEAARVGPLVERLGTLEAESDTLRSRLEQAETVMAIMATQLEDLKSSTPPPPSDPPPPEKEAEPTPDPEPDARPEPDASPRRKRRWLG